MKVFKIEDISQNLHLDEKGYWKSNSAEEISYPSDGNEECAEIEETSFWFKHRNRAIAATVENFPPSGAIFDIGGGNGYVSKNLIDNGFDCVLIEPGASGASKAVERGVKNVICASVESAEFRPHSIPGVGLFDVIEHIEDDAAFLKNIHSLMIPGGKLYATVPAYNFLWSAEDVYAGHFRRYTIDSICDVLRKAEFQIEYATYFFSFLPPIVFLFRSLPTLLGKKHSASAESSKKDHQIKEGAGSKIINRLLSIELEKIKQKKRIPIGGSCLIVAQS